MYNFECCILNEYRLSPDTDIVNVIDRCEFIYSSQVTINNSSVVELLN